MIAEIKNMIRDMQGLTVDNLDSEDIESLQDKIIFMLNRELERIEGCGWCRQYKRPNMWECSPIDEEGNNVSIDGIIMSTSADFCPVCGKELIVYDDDCEDCDEEQYIGN